MSRGADLDTAAATKIELHPVEQGIIEHTNAEREARARAAGG